MPNVKAIVFDLDGTLIHSAPDLQLAANAALHAIGRAPLDLATIISFIGDGVEALVRRALDATGGADDALFQTVLAHFLDVYAQNVTTHTRPYVDVIAALEQFRAAGIPLGICTNKPTGPARAICEQLALAPYFDVIVGAEPGQPKKPDPASLLASIKALGCDPDQALYVGDSAVDYQTARNAQVRFRHFSGGYLNTALPELGDADRFDDWAKHGITPTGRCPSNLL
ncbi:phosphoglycolate phosphatase [Tateyamaria armeniaca]|uniref:phosphoglycolate phosphatase n=1 Tax=Tateyamaria armeniaca TaxID=2518930 RepID=A0ABW8UQW4_9RHOB